MGESSSVGIVRPRWFSLHLSFLRSEDRLGEKEGSGGSGERGTPAKAWRAFAGLVAENLFEEYDLTPEEFVVVADTLMAASGGAELRRLWHFSTVDLPSGRYDLIDVEKLQDVLYYHLSAADWERLALRTGGALIHGGGIALGRKLLEMTAEGDWRPPSINSEDGFLYVEIALGAMMFSLLIFGVWAPGALFWVAIAAPIVLTAGIAVWLVGRPKWKVKVEQREARHYVNALDRIDRGAKPSEVFEFDGSLVGHPREERGIYPFEVGSNE